MTSQETGRTWYCNSHRGSFLICCIVRTSGTRSSPSSLPHFQGGTIKQLLHRFPRPKAMKANNRNMFFRPLYPGRQVEVLVGMPKQAAS